MTSPLYFPRLERITARQLLADFIGRDTEELRELSALESVRSYWYPTAPKASHASESDLLRFAEVARETATMHGYPRQLSSKSPERVRFDRAMVERMLELAPMLPVEASLEGVWSFLSLVVAPDVALWRWPNAKGTDDYERILGYPRNVFRRLWWRAFIFQGSTVGERLYEDEAVAILERTQIGGNRQLSLAIGETHLQRFEASARRTDILRDAMKRIRRRHAFLSFHALTPPELQAVIDTAFDEAEAALLRKTAVTT